MKIVVAKLIPSNYLEQVMYQKFYSRLPNLSHRPQRKTHLCRGYLTPGMIHKNPFADKTFEEAREEFVNRNKKRKKDQLERKRKREQKIVKKRKKMKLPKGLPVKKVNEEVKSDENSVPVLESDAKVESVQQVQNNVRNIQKEVFNDKRALVETFLNAL